MTITTLDRVLDYIDENGPASREDLRLALRITEGQVHNALFKGVRAGQLHCRGAVGPKAGVYALGRAPGWLPKPLPANSIWQHADRIAVAVANQPIPEYEPPRVPTFSVWCLGASV